MTCPTILCPITEHSSWQTFEGGAFDGEYIYVPTRPIQNGIRRVPVHGGGAPSALWTDTSPDNMAYTPTVDEVGQVLYWTRRLGPGDTFQQVMAYDLTQGVGGTATVLFSAPEYQEIVPVRFHATDGMLYAVTDDLRGGSAGTTLVKLDPATSAITDLYTLPDGDGRLVTFDPAMTTTPDGVWGTWALEDAHNNFGVWRWGLSDSAMTFFDPVFTTSGGSREVPLALIGLRDETVVSTWLHNLSASSSVSTELIVMSADFSWTVVCAPGKFTPPYGDLDATAPGWKYVVMADLADTHVLRYPGLPGRPYGSPVDVPASSVAVPLAVAEQRQRVINVNKISPVRLRAPVIPTAVRQQRITPLDRTPAEGVDRTLYDEVETSIAYGAEATITWGGARAPVMTGGVSVATADSSGRPKVFSVPACEQTMFTTVVSATVTFNDVAAGTSNNGSRSLRVVARRASDNAIVFDQTTTNTPLSGHNTKCTVQGNVFYASGPFTISATARSLNGGGGSLPVTLLSGAIETFGGDAYRKLAAGDKLNQRIIAYSDDFGADASWSDFISRVDNTRFLSIDRGFDDDDPFVMYLWGWDGTGTAENPSHIDRLDRVVVGNFDFGFSICGLGDAEHFAIYAPVSDASQHGTRFRTFRIVNNRIQWLSPMTTVLNPASLLEDIPAVSYSASFVVWLSPRYVVAFTSARFDFISHNEVWAFLIDAATGATLRVDDTGPIAYGSLGIQTMVAAVRSDTAIYVTFDTGTGFNETIPTPWQTEWTVTAGFGEVEELDPALAGILERPFNGGTTLLFFQGRSTGHMSTSESGSVGAGYRDCFATLFLSKTVNAGQGFIEREELNFVNADTIFRTQCPVGAVGSAKSAIGTGLVLVLGFFNVWRLMSPEGLLYEVESDFYEDYDNAFPDWEILLNEQAMVGYGPLFEDTNGDEPYEFRVYIEAWQPFDPRPTTTVVGQGQRLSRIGSHRQRPSGL